MTLPDIRFGPSTDPGGAIPESDPFRGGNYLFLFTSHLFVCLGVCLFTYLYIYLSIYLFIYLFIYLLIYLCGDVFLFNLFDLFLQFIL